MNKIIEIYAWSPFILTFLSFIWIPLHLGYIRTNPKILFVIGISLVAYFALNVYSGSLLAEAANCTHFNAAKSEGCVLLGQDVSGALYSFMVLPWLGFLILGVAMIYVAFGLLLWFGLLSIVKILLYLIVGSFILSFISGLFFGFNGPNP